MTRKLSIAKDSVLYESTRIAFGVLLLSALAQINIPIKPVPITLHTVGAALIALTYSPRESVLTWASYLFLGFVGLPIFTGFSYGVEKLIGPSSGYYYGMMVGSFIASYVRTKNNINLKLFRDIIMLVVLVHLVTFSLGISILAGFVGLHTAILSGFVIFIPTGILKSLIFSLIFRLIYEKTV
jgi:biotin transport system substrate-specific component